MAGTAGLKFRFTQSKDSDEFDEPMQKTDGISCIEFNDTGEMLAIGDKSGRIIIFRQETSYGGQYNNYCAFQSHDSEFDYLKSLEIEEKINKIEWLKQKSSSNFLLSTNDKTIKLWRISEKSKMVSGFNLKNNDGNPKKLKKITSLKIPKVVSSEPTVKVAPRRVFSNAHAYHINSISANCDLETYISADDLRINLWNLDVTNESFTVVDKRPENMDQLSEIITTAKFHPKECNIFVYGTSRGLVRMCDMRSAALCDRHSKLFEDKEGVEKESFFSEIISNLSDIKVSNNGDYMMTRNFMAIKTWDFRMETKPVEVYAIHDYLRPKFCSLYETEAMFDKFECNLSGNSRYIIAGSYNNVFLAIDRASHQEHIFEVDKRNMLPGCTIFPRKINNCIKRKKGKMLTSSFGFHRKILHSAWHPVENIIAVPVDNSLLLFEEDNY